MGTQTKIRDTSKSCLHICIQTLTIKYQAVFLGIVLMMIPVFCAHQDMVKMLQGYNEGHEKPTVSYASTVKSLLKGLQSREAERSLTIANSFEEGIPIVPY